MATKTSQHTPGPWRVEASGSVRIPFGIVGSEGLSVAHVQWDEHSDYEPEANARLIAAAPEMLTQLREWAELGCSEHAPNTEQCGECLTCHARALLATIEDRA